MVSGGSGKEQRWANVALRAERGQQSQGRMPCGSPTARLALSSHPAGALHSQLRTVSSPWTELWSRAQEGLALTLWGAASQAPGTGLTERAGCCREG